MAKQRFYLNTDINERAANTYSPVAKSDYQKRQYAFMKKAEANRSQYQQDVANGLPQQGDANYDKKLALYNSPEQVAIREKAKQPVSKAQPIPTVYSGQGQVVHGNVGASQADVERIAEQNKMAGMSLADRLKYQGIKDNQAQQKIYSNEAGRTNQTQSILNSVSARNQATWGAVKAEQTPEQFQGTVANYAQQVQDQNRWNQFGQRPNYGYNPNTSSYRPAQSGRTNTNPKQTVALKKKTQQDWDKNLKTYGYTKTSRPV